MTDSDAREVRGLAAVAGPQGDWPEQTGAPPWALESYRVSYRVDLTGLPGTPSLPGK